MKSKTNMKVVCFIVFSLLAAVDAASFERASQHLRQPSYEDPGKKQEEEKDVPAVVKVERKVRQHHAKVMNAIDRFRAEVCAKMKDQHGMKFKTFDACHKFMEDACKPGRDDSMDGDRQEVSSGKGYCKEYFPEAEKKAEKEVEKEEEFEVVSPAPGPFPAPGPAPAPKATEKAPAPAPAKAAKVDSGSAPAAADAPAPAPMGAPSPGPAPVPAPFIPGISGGKPWGPIGKDEAYYYKDGGKDMARMHMSEKQKLPAQGYWGKLVEHEDMETATGDWQAEFGPKSGGSAADACRHHPDNAWCRRKGFGRRIRSSSATAFAQVLPLAIAVLASSVFH